MVDWINFSKFLIVSIKEYFLKPKSLNSKPKSGCKNPVDNLYHQKQTSGLCKRTIDGNHVARAACLMVLTNTRNANSNWRQINKRFLT